MATKRNRYSCTEKRGSMVLSIGVFLLLFWSVEVIGYIFLLPGSLQKPLRPSPLTNFFGNVAYGAAYALSLLRSPLGLIPYLVKLLRVFGLKSRYEARRTSYFHELLNMLGEIGNLALTFILIRFLIGNPTLSTLPWYLPIGAESIRILAERLPITFSATWQLIPHQKIAAKLQHYAQKSRMSYGLL